jgi:hypothetical protein
MQMGQEATAALTGLMRAKAACVGLKVAALSGLPTFAVQQPGLLISLITTQICLDFGARHKFETAS